MGEIALDGKFALVIVAIVVAIILVMVWFRRRYPTPEERFLNRSRFWFASALAIVVILGIYIVYVYSLEDKMKTMSSGSARPEYGVREAFSEWREQKAAESKARADAKKAGKSSEQVTEAARQAKADFRQVKRAGQTAAQRAKEAERAKLGLAKPPPAVAK